MAKGAGQKQKLLVLQNVLLERTDEEHPISTQALIDTLAAQGIPAERKSIYDDMEVLRQAGLDIQSRKGKDPGWFVGQRPFQLPELKLLVDAVQSCKFITKRKSDDLIRKLEGLTSAHQARQLQRQVYVDRRVKTMNESVYYSIDKLHTALASGKAVTFRYFDYSVRKEKVFRRNGRRYTVFPHGLIWDSENYYLVGWDGAKKEVRHYRVDKMSELAVTCLRLENGEDLDRPTFDMAAYAAKHFGMFSGREGKVRLRCANTMVGVMLDRFGPEVILVPDGPDHFTLTVEAVVSPQFFGWLFGLGDGVVLTSPDWAVEDYRSRLRAAAEQIPSS
ncbi:helix-turn-helix transcriptional regulator [Intestinimonas butyriciproducens]|uniref:helix-turn-helix transcriptional regulator n=1 Tax=Intestinimonas butyriciproducens TaxID=1297617 RepID=UPI001958235D|nr:WYL domain-containing protein [Intestinimonas butyriciproducens]MBM6976116.1 WYL domain-containing protein [Intestinimonas butyriciproducens]